MLSVPADRDCNAAGRQAPPTRNGRVRPFFLLFRHVTEKEGDVSRTALIAGSSAVSWIDGSEGQTGGEQTVPAVDQWACVARVM